MTEGHFSRVSALHHTHERMKADLRGEKKALPNCIEPHVDQFEEFEDAGNLCKFARGCLLNDRRGSGTPADSRRVHCPRHKKVLPDCRCSSEKCSKRSTRERGGRVTRKRDVTFTCLLSLLCLLAYMARRGMGDKGTKTGARMETR